MLGIVIDMIILAVLLNLLSDADLGWGGIFLLALGTSIGTFILALVLIASMGPNGLIIAAVGGALGLAVAVSAFAGVDLRRAGLISLLFMVIHIGVSFAVSAAVS
jgi:hypothetical protein